MKDLYWKAGPWCRGAAFSPDGKWLATVPDLRIWNPEGELVAKLNAWGETAVCWSGDSTRLATVGTEGVGRIWNVDGSVAGPQIEGVGGGIVWNPARPQIATTRGIALTTWDADTGEPQWISLSVAGRSFRVTASGEPLGDFDHAVAEQELVYQVRGDDGRLELLTPSRFTARVAAARDGAVGND